MYAILMYTEHDGDTRAYGPIETLPEARDEVVRMAEIVATKQHPASIDGSVVQRFDEHGDAIIFDERFAATEPSDDDYHVTLTIEPINRMKG